MMDQLLSEYEYTIEALQNERRQLRLRLLAFVSRYDRDNPLRTADVHDPDCGCMRCERDRAAALLAKVRT